MKEKRSYVFVDDGHPESADFDTNYIEYDPEPDDAPAQDGAKHDDSLWTKGNGYIGFVRRRHILKSH